MEKKIIFFDRYLTLWVAICIVIGIVIGKIMPYTVKILRGMEFGKGSQINISIAFLKYLISATALLSTLALIFVILSDNTSNKWFSLILIVIPILVHVYFNFSIVYLLMKKFRVNFSVAAPVTLIGASNFFELAVATAITLLGLDLGQRLLKVLGVLVEVPVMFSVAKICKNTREKFCYG